jgi:hypothetical protein
MVSLATPPFSATSSWNTPVSSDSTFTKLNWPTSTGYNYSVAWDSYSPSVFVASSSDPIVQVSYPAGWGYPGGTISVHMPAGANGAAGTDGELIVIDGDVAYNFWQFKRTSNTTATAASFGAENVVTGDGWGSKSPFLSAGITAVGASQLGGLLVKAETDDGSIDHALQLVVDAKLVMSGFTGQAIAGDGGSASGIVKEGQLLAITPNTPMPSGLSPLGQQVFTAMQKYGAYVVDVAGGVTNVRAQANAYDNATMTALWHDMGKITPLLQAVSTQSAPGTGAPSTPTTPNTPGTGGVATPTDTTAPTIQWIAATGSGITNGNGRVSAGGTVRLSVNFSEAVNVTGTPTLSLNSNGTAKYVSGSGSNTLQFDYKVGAGQSAADLAITGFSLGGVKDKAGNAVSLSGAPRQPAGTLAIGGGAATTPTDTTAPTIQWIAATGSGITNGNGRVSAGGTVRLSVNFSEAVNVTGTPTLSLNSNGTAKYVSGSGSNTLQFDYKVGAGQSAADLAITGFSLSGVKDKAGNAVSLSGAPRQPGGTLAIGAAASTRDTTAPTIQWIAATGSGITNGNGRVTTGGTVRLSVNFSKAVNVTGTPTLSLNSNGTAKYVRGSGSTTLQFDYKVGAGQSAADLAITGFSLSGVKDKAGNAVSLSGAPRQPGGTLAIGAAAPAAAAATKLAATQSASDLAANATAFGNTTTLGYAASASEAGRHPTAADGAFMSKMALLSQYAASSFEGSRPGLVATPTLNAAAEFSQTLAKSHR